MRYAPLRGSIFQQQSYVIIIAGEDIPQCGVCVSQFQMCQLREQLLYLSDVRQKLPKRHPFTVRHIEDCRSLSDQKSGIQCYLNSPFQIAWIMKQKVGQMLCVCVCVCVCEKQLDKTHNLRCTHLRALTLLCCWATLLLAQMLHPMPQLWITHWKASFATNHVQYAAPIERKNKPTPTLRHSGQSHTRFVVVVLFALDENKAADNWYWKEMSLIEYFFK